MESANGADRISVDQQVQRNGFTYNAEKVIGNGSFGMVYQAQVVETGEIVAIKKVFQDKRYKNRELQIMKELSHPNIVTLKHAFYTSGDKPDEVFLNVVMEYMSDTVYRVMKQYTKQNQSLPFLLVKLYTYQICRGLTYIHQMGICHRDIKPQNLLVDVRTHTLKVCDFGSAKRLVPGEANVSYICSRYYRAPELIFGATNYTNVIDVWSMGCVMAEMMMGQPLFPGESGVDQLVEIIKVMGSPMREDILSMNANYTEFKFPNVKTVPWQRVFRGKASDAAIETVGGFLRYDPQSRSNTVDALTGEFFDELREPSTMLTISGSLRPLPDLFNFTPEEERARLARPNAAALLSRLHPRASARSSARGVRPPSVRVAADEESWRKSSVSDSGRLSSRRTEEV